METTESSARRTSNPSPSRLAAICSGKNERREEGVQGARAAFEIRRHRADNQPLPPHAGPARMPAEPVGTLKVALAHAERLLRSQPGLAAEQAAAILEAIPGYPPALLIAGKAQRLNGELAAALGTFAALAEAHPDWVFAHLEHGLTLGAAGQGEAAVAALRRAVTLKPDLPDA